ncbi:aminopeptidase N [Nesterenkonia sp. LB17]|uniref:aminopeptidase N n=1 Tax=Nesterenkonia sp. LB17 TaxID=2901230 RepID=UPI001F4CDB9F|nr:aminopeptidase N [Nesterenkonia sp. LB17]MCH8564957.1 aminopeptidase N [Nesterenkonia sp. LB17]
MTAQLPFPRADVENLTREEAAQRGTLLEVTHYRVEVDLRGAPAPKAETYPVRTRIDFASSAVGVSTFLDHLGASVESLVLNGETLDVAAHVGPARILLPGLRAENTVEIRSTSRYSRSGEGLHRFVDPSDEQVYLYTQYEPADSRRVFPVFEQPDLKARFSFSIIGPQHWQLRSNSPAISRMPLESGEAAGAAKGEPAGADDAAEAAGAAVVGPLVRVEFAETPRMSSYITALLAGPYHHVEGHYRGGVPGGETVQIPLSVLCRASLAEHFDADALLELTQRGLDFFHAEFAYPYPWGKYDQVFVPEYNLGAMENPGLVTFTETYVFDTAATDAQYETRANTLMHEMAHMWFGDLVTMHWWDDLWLKESFADYMGSLAVDEATDWTTSWISFANGRKAWAYVQDQLPTTHPIVADIPDLEAADQNFDGITYAKGASVLKQLAAYAGREAFREAARRYFSRHAFGNASLGDFLAVLEEVTGANMDDWARAWLQTAGVPVLSAELDAAGGGADRVLVREQGVAPATGESVSRPHKIRVGVHVLDAAGETLALHAAQEVFLDPAAPEGLTPVPELSVPADRPRLLLPNEDDLTYAKLSLDPESLAAVLTYPVADPLARATVWAALWSMVRDGELPARRFLAAVQQLGLGIDEIVVVQGLLRQSLTALERYTPADERPALQRDLAARLAAELTRRTGGDHQRATARTLATLSRREGSQLELLEALLDGGAADHGISGLRIDEELRWAFLQALAAHGRVSLDQLDAELAAKTTARARIAHRLAAAARPDRRVKQAAFGQALAGTDDSGEELSNDHLTATVDGFTVAGDPETAAVIERQTEAYFDALTDVWERMSQGQATRVVSGLYPGAQDLDAGAEPTEHPLALRTQRWLDENADAPAALRRLLIEEQDQLLRGLRAQAAAQG